MTASECPEGFQKITLSIELIDELVRFLIHNTQGPAEAMALLHAGIAAIDEMNGSPRSAVELGQELTMDLIAGGNRSS